LVNFQQAVAKFNLALVHSVNPSQVGLDQTAPQCDSEQNLNRLLKGNAALANASRIKDQGQ
jgi:hypothetical protein